MKIKDLTNAPQWLMDAIVEHEDVEIDRYDCAIWHGGVWHGGDWHGGVWRGEKITRAPVLIASLPHWEVMISDTRMMIGLQIHTHAEWAGFDDAAIVAMDRQALRFWREYKTALLAMCESRKVVKVTP